MISVDFLADFLGIGRSVFFEKIKKATGKTPHQLLLNERLRRSLILLSDTSMKRLSVAEVADTLGFSSAAYFRRIFKHTFGYPPSELPARTKLPPGEVTKNHN
ncbi:MAG: hypothetical protein CO090_01730 [Acidobacteria bacterium CG_4_9_14_3_um_filter_49_7]|nr:MAG: hypothetical protein CO090_01730 [Acidobacteria bacterium CG_4_9_14_3_um_filter_49_7]